MSLDSVLAHIDADQDKAQDRLLDLLRIQSISTDSAYKEECDKAANWLVKDLESLGFEASKRPTPGHPMVIGHQDGDGIHVTFYGHYDVQPVDPLDLWDNPPFEPAIEDTPSGKVIRGRGSSDDKGQLMTFLEACRAWKAVTGSLPVKVSIFFEGEEESGSPSLVPFLKENAEELKSDITLICDTGMVTPKTPSIVTMLRGLVGQQVTITGPSKDLHSGMFGGPARNPIRVLNKALAALHDDDGAVTLPGFYDGVPELPEQVAEQWRNLDWSAESFLGDVGLSLPAGEKNRSAIEQIWSRPTCDVNGIWGGYIGEGSKTVIPSQAHAKVSFRLVGTQDPHKIRAAFQDHIRSHLPADCSAEFIDYGAAPASNMEITHPAFEAARTALSDEWENDGVYVGCGGSIPIAGHFQKILGTESMLIGFGQDDDQIHSPNEKYDLRSFHKGIRSWARILDSLSRNAA
ncbi:MAG: M20/M25/M40 family metallo-hydrolase [Rhodobacteraceae bacterium]|nr:M20/M25/M40 family metallo-hydrolase [Paracoccaceae bacterium]